MTPPPVVLLHGQPGAGSDWDAVVAALPAGTPTFAPDRPGYRSNPLPPAGIEGNARWVLDELDRAGLTDVVLVGHSFGGGVALTVAAMAPERVRGLLLVASVGPGCLDGWDALLAAPLTGEVTAVTAWLLTPWVIRRHLAGRERALGRPLLGSEHVYKDAWGNARHEHGSMWRTFLVEQRDLVRGDAALDERIAQVRVPTVVVTDPGDRIIDAATSTTLAERIPGARLVRTVGGGHHLPRRAPEEVARLAAGL